MKVKLMALMLAAGLGITGIAMTTLAAQAAGANTTAGCKHETLHLEEHLESATYHDGYRHYSTYAIGYRCYECMYFMKTNEAYKLEPHDYEQVYYHDGTVMSTCLVCKDTYYW